MPAHIRQMSPKPLRSKGLNNMAYFEKWSILFNLKMIGLRRVNATIWAYSEEIQLADYVAMQEYDNYFIVFISRSFKAVGSSVIDRNGLGDT